MTVGPSAREWGLAVDFGTTATAAATVTAGQISPLALDGAGRMSSSVYAAGSESELLVGKQADNEAAYALERYEPTPKRRIHRPSVRLGDRQFTPAELIAAIMAQVFGDALNQHNGMPPTWQVLTHPVAWPSSQQKVLAEAARLASRQLGFSADWPHRVFVSEPEAAAHWYSRDTHHDPPQVGQKIAVYDLGGGTFDVAVLERTEQGFSVIHSGGINPLGGYDFDHRLFTYLGNTHIAPQDAELWRGLQRPDSGDVETGERRRQMWSTVRYLKEQLSTKPSREIRLRGVDQPVLVTRAEFETLIVADVDRTIDELLTTLDECDLAIGDLACIYRVGGASRIPLVGQKLEALGAPVHAYDDPKLVVALGAAAMPAPPRGPVPFTPPRRPVSYTPPMPQPEALPTAADPVDPPAPRDEQRDTVGAKNELFEPKIDSSVLPTVKPRNRRRKLWIGLVATAVVVAVAVTTVLYWQKRSAAQELIANTEWRLPDVDDETLNAAQVGSCVDWRTVQPSGDTFSTVVPCDQTVPGNAYKVLKRVSEPEQCDLGFGRGQWRRASDTGVVLCVVRNV